MNSGEKAEEKLVLDVCVHVCSSVLVSSYIYLVPVLHQTFPSLLHYFFHPISSARCHQRRRPGYSLRMTSTDPTPTTQTNLEENSDDQALDPPTLPFVSIASNVADVKISSTRSSFTQVDHDEEQPIPSSSRNQDPSLSPVPASQGATSNSNQAPELISTLSQDQQQPVQRPPTPSTQPQVMPETVPQTPQTYLTFLFISGRRRTMSFEPESAIGRVKELAWNSWPTGQCLPRPL